MIYCLKTIANKSGLNPEYQIYQEKRDRQSTHQYRKKLDQTRRRI